MNPQKNYIDERGNYHNVENLTLTQIHDRASEEGYRLGKAEAQKYDGDLISRKALLNAINENNELFEKERIYLEGLILNTPAITPQLPREVRQALEVLEHIKERYILVEKSPTDDPSALLVGKLANNQNETK